MSDGQSTGCNVDNSDNAEPSSPPPAAAVVGNDDGNSINASAMAVPWPCVACGVVNGDNNNDNGGDLTTFFCTNCGTPAQNPGQWPPRSATGAVVEVRAPTWRCERWRADLYAHPECHLQWAWTAAANWLFTGSWDYRFMIRMLAHGMFTIPDRPGMEGHSMLMLPNPRARLVGLIAVSYTHLTLPTIYSV